MEETTRFKMHLDQVVRDATPKIETIKMVKINNRNKEFKLGRVLGEIKTNLQDKINELGINTNLQDNTSPQVKTTNSLLEIRRRQVLGLMFKSVCKITQVVIKSKTVIWYKFKQV